MLPLTAPQIELLARAHDSPEFKMLRAWILASADKMTREALRTANPHLCGAAALLQDLSDTLGSVPDFYRTVRKTDGSAPFST